jgi:phosphopantetheine--protein transferase-like protein
MEILGIGIDIVDLKLFSDTTISTPGILSRIFSEDEIMMNNSSLGGVFAAKEAIHKALTNFTFVPLGDIKVIRDGKKPKIQLSGNYSNLNETLRMEVSISHHGNYAVAVGMVLREKELHPLATR